MLINKIQLDLTCTPKGENYLLRLCLSENELGVIYRVTAVLFAYGWDILEANFGIDTTGQIEDLFLIHNFQGGKMGESELQKIRSDLDELFFQDLLVVDYLERFPSLTLMRPSDQPPMIRIFNPSTTDSTILDIRTKDRPGLLFEISQLLYLLDIDIISVTAKSEDGIIRDSFLLRMNGAQRLKEDTIEKLQDGLQKIL
jgi:[protein-PII] uridylyltransferase